METSLLSQDGAYENRTGELLAILRAAPAATGAWKERKSPPHRPLWEGNLFKLRQNGQWKEFHFTLRGGLLLSYAANAGDKPRRTLSVAYASLITLESEDALVTQQVVTNAGGGAGSAEGVDFCRERLHIFTPTRTYVLGAASDVEIEACYQALHTAMASLYTSSEEAEKRAAHRELEPLMKSQREAQVSESIHLYNVLESLGMLAESGGATSGWFAQQGRLELMEHVKGTSKFRTYYFGIRNGYMLYYEDASDHRTPLGCIALAAASVRRPPPEATVESVREMDGDHAHTHNTSTHAHAADADEGARREGEAKPEATEDVLGPAIERVQSADAGEPSGFLFEIITPLRVYILRAPAELLIHDWAKAIREGSKIGAEVAAGDAKKAAGHESAGTKVKKLLRSASGYHQVEPALMEDDGSAIGSADDGGDGIHGAEGGPTTDPRLVVELVFSKTKAGRVKEKRLRIKPDHPVQIGRLGTNEIVITDPHASRQHARVVLEGNDVVVYDLGSRVGTQVNGVNVQTRRLVNGDVIQVGEFTAALSMKTKDGDCCVM